MSIIQKLKQCFSLLYEIVFVHNNDLMLNTVQCKFKMYTYNEKDNNPFPGHLCFGMQNFACLCVGLLSSIVLFYLFKSVLKLII